MPIVPFRPKRERKEPPPHYAFSIQLALEMARKQRPAQEDLRMLLTIIAIQENRLAEFIRFNRAQRRITKIKEKREC